MMCEPRGRCQPPKRAEATIDADKRPRHGGNRGGGSLVRYRRRSWSLHGEARVTAQGTARDTGTVIATSRALSRDTVARLLPL